MEGAKMAKPVKVDLWVPIDIERLVTWALRDQGLGWDAPARGSSLDRLASLGTMISGGAIADPSIGLLSDEDAIHVRQGIDMLPREAAGLVVVHGRAGTRPEGADEQLGEPEQLRNKRGQLMWDYDNPRSRRGYRRPKLDMLGWSQKRDSIDFARKQWTLWRESLVSLIGPLNEVMRHHRATGPEVAAEPWLQPKRTVLSVEAMEVPTDPQPWLKAERPMRKPDHTVTVEELKREAQAEVRSVARDWGDPTQPIQRRKPRVAAAKEAAE